VGTLALVSESGFWKFVPDPYGFRKLTKGGALSLESKDSFLTCNPPRRRPNCSPFFARCALPALTYSRIRFRSSCATARGNREERFRPDYTTRKRQCPSSAMERLKADCILLLTWFPPKDILFPWRRKRETVQFLVRGGFQSPLSPSRDTFSVSAGIIGRECFRVLVTCNVHKLATGFKRNA
jgi:hypothetical protein